MAIILYRLFSIWLPKELEFLRSEDTDLLELFFNWVEIPDAGSARTRLGKVLEFFLGVRADLEQPIQANCGGKLPLEQF